jgi:hypothetical protein
MSKALEKVARAICRQFLTTLIPGKHAAPPESEVDLSWPDWKEEAAAAISAHEAALAEEGMVIVPREPTPEMLDAGYCEAPKGIDALIAHWETLSPEDIWPAMVDAALTPPKEPS